MSKRYPFEVFGLAARISRLITQQGLEMRLTESFEPSSNHIPLVDALQVPWALIRLLLALLTKIYQGVRLLARPYSNPTPSNLQ